MKKRGRKSSGKKEKEVEESSESGDAALENDTNEDNRKASKRKTAERKQDTDDESDHPVEKKRAKKGKKQKSKKAGKGSGSEDDESEKSGHKKSKTPKAGPAEEENGGGDEADDDSEDDFESSPAEKKKAKKGKKKQKNKKAVKGSASEDDVVESEKNSRKKKGGAAEEENGGGEESEDESEEDYEVESILDHKFINGTKHYLIRWKGYEAESDTWEPASTVNCADLVSKYNAKLKKEKKNKKAASEPTWDENEDFEVSRILEVHFNRDGSREFLVNWKGYPASENTWEPEENMDCKDLIAKFMEKVEKAKDCGVKELRTHRATTDRLTLLMHAGAGRRASKRNKGTQRIHYHDQE